MNGLLTAALEIQSFCLEQGWRFCVIGGIAVSRGGQPRATQDVDVSLLAGFGNEQPVIQSLLDQFEERIPDAAAFALQSRVVLASASNGVALDIALAAYPFEERVIERATPYAFSENAELITASAEDLIVLKAFAGRDQDWSDVGGIIARQSDRLNWNQILGELEPLCGLNEDESPVKRLQTIRDSH